MAEEIKKIINIVREQIIKKRKQFVFIVVFLALETITLLFVPQIISSIIDGLEKETDAWLYGYILAYCLTIILAGCVKILNKYVSEKVGWSLCDSLRTNMFKRILNFDIRKHKNTQSALFLEKLEGDVNQLGTFFSTMLVDMAESLILVIGVLCVFFYKFYLIGIAFTFMSVLILFIFIRI